MPFGDFSAYGNQLRPEDRQVALRNAMIQTGLGLIGNREGLAGIAPQLQQGFGQFNQGVRESIEARLLQQDVARQEEEDQRRRTTFQQGQEDRKRAEEERKQKAKDLEELQEQAFKDLELREEVLAGLREKYGDDPTAATFMDIISTQRDQKGFNTATNELMDYLVKKEQGVVPKNPVIRGSQKDGYTIFNQDGSVKATIPGIETEDDERDPLAIGGEKYRKALGTNLNRASTATLFAKPLTDDQKAAGFKLSMTVDEQAKAEAAFEMQWRKDFLGPGLKDLIPDMEDAIAKGEITNADEARAALKAIGTIVNGVFAGTIRDDIIEEVIASLNFPGSVEAPPFLAPDLGNVGSFLSRIEK